GTAVVTLAGLINALKITGKRKEDIRVVINGAGAAGISIAKLLLSDGIENIILCDKTGALYHGRSEDMNSAKDEIAMLTNRNKEKGTLADIIKGADVFIGVSVANVLTAEMVKTMAEDPIVFACANPVPEIYPD